MSIDHPFHPATGFLFTTKTLRQWIVKYNPQIAYLNADDFFLLADRVQSHCYNEQLGKITCFGTEFYIQNGKERTGTIDASGDTPIWVEHHGKV